MNYGLGKSTKRDRASWAWLSQAITGISLVILLGIHWIAQHYLATGGLRTFAEVITYIANPVVLMLEIAFLVVVTYHALLGVRAVLLDLGPSQRLMRWLNAGLILTGIATVTYGIYLLRLILTT